MIWSHLTFIVFFIYLTSSKVKMYKLTLVCIKKEVQMYLSFYFILFFLLNTYWEWSYFKQENEWQRTKTQSAFTSTTPRIWREEEGGEFPSSVLPNNSTLL